MPVMQWGSRCLLAEKLFVLVSRETPSLFTWGFQMLVCSVDGELYPPLEEQTVSTDPKANKKKDKDREKKFIWNHGSE